MCHHHRGDASDGAVSIDSGIDSVFGATSSSLSPGYLSMFALCGCAGPSNAMSRLAIITSQPASPEIPLTLQPRQPNISQSVLRQHPPHRSPKHLPSAPFIHHPLHRHTLQTSWSRAVAVVQFLLHLLPRNADVLAVGGDDVVAAVGGGVVDGFVLAHEGDGDAGGDAAEWERGGVEREVVPGASVG